ncbi:hypothetical protein U14_04394 [Candidatus Moduliflexus flocculans]|uniref:Peptidase M23 domain-containing protein n=1 Tax=Candidatus Moduliflexus flocculans TaxID=1499966 RepID=A0A0S6W630_9BACT|nr:hypothetical protein U14_04394 [Candidatus Moduliflexus flocculans]
MRWIQRFCNVSVMVMALLTIFAASHAHAQLKTSTGFFYPTNSYWDGSYIGWLQTNGGNGQYHLAIDFKENYGTPVVAIADGEVVAETFQYVSGQDEGGALVVKHQLSDGSYFTALYGHISLIKRQGETVKAGEQIGTITNCWTQWGNLTHLHFEIHPNPSVIWTPAYTWSTSDLKGCVDPLAFMNNNTPASQTPPQPEEPSISFQGQIDDTFIGEGYQWVEQNKPNLLSQGSDYQYADIIGYNSWDYFNIRGMNIGIRDGKLTVDIRTDYTPGIVPGTQNARTDYGDLFLSLNGWTPDSEVWEYVFDTSVGKLYDIRNAQDHILYSDDVYGERYNTQSYRHGQEVEIDPTNLVAIADGTTSKTNGLYSMTFDITKLGLLSDFSLAFHWTMGCANDVIEGMVSAPEPSTMLLLSSGLLGVLAFRNKLLKQRC